MTCPRCHTADLVERDRSGISIDVCPSCRGVWLDRGELEKLIERAVDDRAGHDDDDDDRSAAYARGRRDRDDRDDDDRDHDRRRGKRSWWAELFD